MKTVTTPPFRERNGGVLFSMPSLMGTSPRGKKQTTLIHSPPAARCAAGGECIFPQRSPFLIPRHSRVYLPICPPPHSPTCLPPRADARGGRVGGGHHIIKKRDHRIQKKERLLLFNKFSFPRRPRAPTDSPPKRRTVCIGRRVLHSLIGSRPIHTAHTQVAECRVLPPPVFG